MSSLLLPLAAALVLLAGNALLVACVFALLRLRLTLFRREVLGEAVEQPAIGFLQEHADSIQRFCRFGAFACTLGYGLLFFTALQPVLADAGGAIFSAAVAFLLTVLLHYAVSDLVPRTLGLRHAVGLLRLMAWPLRIGRILLSPVLGPLYRIDRFLLGLFGARDTAGLELLEFEEQIKAAEAASPESSSVSREIVKNALQIRQRAVKDVLLPRNQIQYFDIADGNAFNIELAKRTGHTRFPLCEGDLDHCIGIIHIKDVFRAAGDPGKLDFRKLRRRIARVKPDDPLEEVLARLLREKMHMALVIDPFGGVTGVVTLEQILEELVGDIQDEFDVEEDDVKEIADGVFLVSGLTALHDMEEALGVPVEVDEDLASTFGGLITAELGYIPDKEEELVLLGGRLHVVVTEVDERRVIAARVRVIESEEVDEPAAT